MTSKEQHPTDAAHGLSYDEAIAELEQIVRDLQRSDCRVDLLRQHASRSVVLLGICKEKLSGIDQELQKLMDEIA